MTLSTGWLPVKLLTETSCYQWFAFYILVMLCVVQRVLSAKVTVQGAEVARIGPGLLLLVGVGIEDDGGKSAQLAAQVLKLRVFEDETGRMGRALPETGGELLVVSQFTLMADFSKGNRPSFHRAAHPDVARPVIEGLVAALEAGLGRQVETGIFGAEMKVDLTNDGPATFVLES